MKSTTLLRNIIVALVISQTPVNAQQSSEELPHRMDFFKTIEISLSAREMDERGRSKNLCQNAINGMKLAIALTADPESYEFERRLKGGSILEDFSTWAMRFLIKECSAKEMAPLIEKLLAVESKACKPEEPSLSFAYLFAADFYLNRGGDQDKAMANFDKATNAIAAVKYKPTESYLPERYAALLAPYEELLAAIPTKKKRYREIRILRIQQKAKHMNNVGNKYLDGVVEPPEKSGLYKYEVEHAVDAYSKAIEFIPLWAEPYLGRARAYELLGKHDLAARDRARAGH